MLNPVRPGAGVIAPLCLAIAATLPRPALSETDVIEEITVTARKREEGLQVTPVSISAFTVAALEDRHLADISQIADFTPNLVMNTSASFSGSNNAPAIFMRGIGQVDFTLNTDPGVGLYVDGVYISRSVGGLLDLVDVERIEVLRGPQGTLFGRNTIGGAISVTSRAPAEEFGGRLKITTGSDERIDVQGSVDVPISEQLLTRFTVLSRNRDGYVDRLQDGGKIGNDDALSVRGAALFKPSADLKFQINLDYTNEDEQSAPFVLLSLKRDSAFGGFHNFFIAPLLDPATAGGRCFDPTFANAACYNEASVLTGSAYKTNALEPNISEVEVFGASLSAEWALPAFTLRSITAYRDLESFSERDGDHAPVLVNRTADDYTYDQFSQEIQVLGSAFDARLEWILGGFYFTETGDNANLVTFSVVDILSGGHVENDSYAGFAQGTWHFNDRLSLTAGVRYSEDSREFTPEQFVISSLIGIPPGLPILPNVTADSSASDVTPMANVAYRWTEDLMTYFTYSQGFKSGGFTQRVFPPLFPALGQDPADVIPSFDPEFVEQFEIGWKSTWFGQRLQANGAVFYTDYTDLQVNVQRGIAPTTENAAAAEISGGELELVAAPTDSLLLNFGAGYTDADYQELDADVIGVTLDSRLPGTSEWNLNASISNAFSLGQYGTLTPRLDWVYRSKFFFDANNEVGESGYDVLNASVAWESTNGQWRAMVFGTNITDERYLLAGASILEPGGFQEGIFARPAEWGLSLEYKF